MTTQYTVHSTQYTVQSTQYTVHSTQYTVHSSQYTVHSTQYTVHSTQYTVHSTHSKVNISDVFKISVLSYTAQIILIIMIILTNGLVILRTITGNDQSNIHILVS